MDQKEDYLFQKFLILNTKIKFFESNQAFQNFETLKPSIQFKLFHP